MTAELLAALGALADEAARNVADNATTDNQYERGYVDAIGWAVYRMREIIAAHQPAEPERTLPAGLTISEDGQLLNWLGENYVIQPATDAIEELTEAIRFTVEYVGTETLPPIVGWSWFDALSKYAPEKAGRFRPTHQSERTDTAEVELRTAVGRVVARMSKRNVDHRHPDEIGEWGVRGRAYFYAGDVIEDIVALRMALGLGPLDPTPAQPSEPERGER